MEGTSSNVPERLCDYTVERHEGGTRLVRRRGLTLGWVTFVLALIVEAAIILCGWLELGVALSMTVMGVLGGLLFTASLLAAQALAWRNLVVRPEVLEVLRDASLTLDGIAFSREELRQLRIIRVETDDFEYFDVKIVMSSCVVDFARCSNLKRARSVAERIKNIFGLDDNAAAPPVTEEGSGHNAGAVVGSVLFWGLGVLPASVGALQLLEPPLLAGLTSAGVLLGGTVLSVLLYAFTARRALLRHLRETYGIGAVTARSR